MGGGGGGVGGGGGGGASLIPPPPLPLHGANRCTHAVQVYRGLQLSWLSLAKCKIEMQINPQCSKLAVFAITIT